MFTLDQARAFIAVAEELHFGRAAQRLHMTQPPLSRQIQKLESSLGVTLLLRHPRGVELTAAGESFFIECHQLIRQAERAPCRARLIAAGQVGTIRLGYTAAAAYRVLGRLLAGFKEESPGVVVELHEMVSEKQLEALRNGSIDLGLARPGWEHEDVESHVLLTEALVVAIPSDHTLAARGEPISSAELSGEMLLMHSQGPARYFRELVSSLIQVRPSSVSYSAGQVLTLITLSAAGHGLAVVPESASQLVVPGVTFLPLQESPPDLVELHAMWLAESTNPALKPIVDQLKHIHF